jgi:hypothetical protein
MDPDGSSYASDVLSCHLGITILGLCMGCRGFTYDALLLEESIKLNARKRITFQKPDSESHSIDEIHEFDGGIRLPVS